MPRETWQRIIKERTSQFHVTEGSRGSSRRPSCSFSMRTEGKDEDDNNNNDNDDDDDDDDDNDDQDHVSSDSNSLNYPQKK